MTKAQRAAELCEFCRAGEPTYFWQGEFTHRSNKKLPQGGVQFRQSVCPADKIWKEEDGRPGISDKLL